MHWSISHFPELDHLEPEQRTRLLARVAWWTYPLIVARAVLPSLALTVVVIGWVTNGLGVRAAGAAAVAIPVAAAAAVLMYAYQLARIRRVMRRSIVEAFRGQRPPFCFRCGYNLRLSSALRCPECGTLLPAPATE